MRRHWGTLHNIGDHPVKNNRLRHGKDFCPVAAKAGQHVIQHVGPVQLREVELQPAHDDSRQHKNT